MLILHHLFHLLFFYTIELYFEYFDYFMHHGPQDEQFAKKHKILIFINYFGIVTVIPALFNSSTTPCNAFNASSPVLGAGAGAG